MERMPEFLIEPSKAGARSIVSSSSYAHAYRCTSYISFPPLQGGRPFGRATPGLGYQPWAMGCNSFGVRIRESGPQGSDVGYHRRPLGVDAKNRQFRSAVPTLVH